MSIHRTWTKEEIDILEDEWCRKSIKTIAKNLNRSIEAVRVKAYRIGLGAHRNQQDYVLLYQLISALGLRSSYSWISEKFEKNGLNVIRKPSIDKKYKAVHLKDFWKWAEQNKRLLNFSKFEKNSLGKEPDWVDEKRRADKLNPSCKNHNRVWTKYEVQILIEKTKSYRYTYSDLSRELNRTEAAIKRKLLDLKVPYRPVPRNNHIKWTDDENRRMIEMFNKGYSNAAIAMELNKTQLSICDRIRALNLT